MRVIPPSARRAWSLLKKVPGKPPAVIARRAAQEARRLFSRPWVRYRPRLLTERWLLARLGHASVDQYWDALAAVPVLLDMRDARSAAAAFRSQFPDREAVVLAEAEAFCRHEFDLLGSGPRQLGWPLPWHEDFIAGRRWPLAFSHSMAIDELDQRSDIKVPWELSRCQHFARLGQAYWLTGDERVAQECRTEIEDWLEQNPWGYGVNWICTMDVALRAVSWIWAFEFFARSRAWQESEFRSQLLRALWLHGEHVTQNLERSDVNGNHYLADALGLVVLGAFFRHARAGARWLTLGHRIIVEEIEAQVHPDGVDHEQSVAYHRLVLECLLTALLAARRGGFEAPARSWARIGRMAEYVAAYSKPDGAAPRIGDADDGRVQKLGTQPLADHRYLIAIVAVLLERGDLKTAAGAWPDEAFWFLGADARGAFDQLPVEPPPESAAFPSGGMYVLRYKDTHVILDAAEVGLRGRGGHGHNDVLSFELVLEGVPLITDAGSYVYTASAEWRHRFRGTASHNTVQVDGEELNRLRSRDDLWSLHYDARPDAVWWAPDSHFPSWAASHLGYRRLADPVVHRRAVSADRDGSAVMVRDQLFGSADHDLVSRMHLEPGFDVTIDGRVARCVRARDGATAFLTVVAADSALTLGVADGWVSPSYGVKLATRVVTLAGRCRLPTTMTMIVSRTAALDRRTGMRAFLESIP